MRRLAAEARAGTGAVGAVTEPAAPGGAAGSDRLSAMRVAARSAAVGVDDVDV